MEPTSFPPAGTTWPLPLYCGAPLGSAGMPPSSALRPVGYCCAKAGNAATAPASASAVTATVILDRMDVFVCGFVSPRGFAGSALPRPGKRGRSFLFPAAVASQVRVARSHRSSRWPKGRGENRLRTRGTDLTAAQGAVQSITVSGAKSGKIALNSLRTLAGEPERPANRNV